MKTPTIIGLIPKTYVIGYDSSNHPLYFAHGSRPDPYGNFTKWAIQCDKLWLKENGNFENNGNIPMYFTSALDASNYIKNMFQISDNSPKCYPGFVILKEIQKSE